MKQWIVAILALIIWGILVWNLLKIIPDSVQIVLFMVTCISLPNLYKVLIQSRREP